MRVGPIYRGILAVTLTLPLRCVSVTYRGASLARMGMGVRSMTVTVLVYGLRWIVDVGLGGMVVVELRGVIP
jgi:hypothetical protein